MATLALSACGRGDAPEPAPPAVPAGVLSPDWTYTPADAETRSATGALTVVPGVGADGPLRVLAAQTGDRLDAVLWNNPPAGASARAAEIAGGLIDRPTARAQLFAVTAGNLCLGAQATHLVWYEPELIEGRALALAVLAGAPGETGSTVCRVLRYTRERSPPTAAAGGDEGSR